MVEKSHAELDVMLRHLMLVGFGALLGWTGATAYGVASASWEIDTNGALRFLLAILIVTFAKRTFDEVLQWRHSRKPVDERFGFATPVWETPRAAEIPAEPVESGTGAPRPSQ
ncbi:MAG: hypothetical protein WD096_09245 [Actinomycetota bacterium]